MPVRWQISGICETPYFTSGQQSSLCKGACANIIKDSNPKWFLLFSFRNYCALTFVKLYSFYINMYINSRLHPASLALHQFSLSLVHQLSIMLVTNSSLFASMWFALYIWNQLLLLSVNLIQARSLSLTVTHLFLRLSHLFPLLITTLTTHNSFTLSLPV